MIDDFDLKQRRKLLINKFRDKCDKKNLLYKEKIDELKLKAERLYEQKDKEYKKKLKRKEQSIQKQLALRTQRILNDNKKFGSKKTNSRNILKKLEEFNKKQEQQRLKLEQETFTKCKKLYKNNFFLYSKNDRRKIQ